MAGDVEPRDRLAGERQEGDEPLRGHRQPKGLVSGDEREGAHQGEAHRPTLPRRRSPVNGDAAVTLR
jgi:hypothetical protein